MLCSVQKYTKFLLRLLKHTHTHTHTHTHQQITSALFIEEHRVGEFSRVREREREGELR